jgi:uncharacterized protein (TIGR02145 family)
MKHLRAFYFKPILFFAAIIICCSASTLLNAQIVVRPGTAIKIGAGTTVTSLQDFTIAENGALNIDGNLELKGNLTNQNPETDLGNGSLTFSGSQAQTLTGQNSISSLVINNANGVNLEGNTLLTDSLVFQAGNIRLGSSNLLLGADATVEGSPNSSKMVVTNGSGFLQKVFSGTGAFSFPVGDETGTADYSPADLNLTAGTPESGGSIGMRVVNEALPGLTSNYLNRHWEVSISNIQNPVYDAGFRYVTADVVGAESQLRCLKATPLPATLTGYVNTLVHQIGGYDFSGPATFAGSSAFQVPKTLVLQHLFLEGLYPGGGYMNKASNGFAPQYNGTIADSISVQLNDGADYSTTMFTNNNVYLTTTGDASVELPYSLNGHYYITVNHRNSLTTASVTPISFANNTILYNFNTPANVYGNNLTLHNDAYCLFSGDVNHDRVIDSTDVDSITAGAATFTKGYVDADINGDGTLDAIDLIITDNHSAQGVTAKLPDWGGQPCPGMPTVTDIDGNQYNTVLIGSQCWMKENLRAIRFSNGDSIRRVDVQSVWDGTHESAYCYPDNLASMQSLYGNLYNHMAVSDTLHICPNGWHIPSSEEVDELANFMGGSSDPNLGTKLKSCRQLNSVLGGACSTSDHPRWNFNELVFGTNDAGFSALPAGIRIEYAGFGLLGHEATWWTSTAYTNSTAYAYSVYDYLNNFIKGVEIRNRGFSVRCVKDN